MNWKCVQIKKHKHIQISIFHFRCNRLLHADYRLSMCEYLQWDFRKLHMILSIIFHEFIISQAGFYFVLLNHRHCRSRNGPKWIAACLMERKKKWCKLRKRRVQASKYTRCKSEMCSDHNGADCNIRFLFRFAIAFKIHGLKF